MYLFITYSVCHSLLIVINPCSVYYYSYPVVPTPGVSIDQPPSPLYAGTSLSLTCAITVNPAVDTTVSVAVTWERTRDTGPVTITTGVSTMGSRPTFSSTVTSITLSSLDTGFTCRAVVDPQAASVIISSPEGMNTQPIVILSKNNSHSISQYHLS